MPPVQAVCVFVFAVGLVIGKARVCVLAWVGARLREERKLTFPKFCAT